MRLYHNGHERWHKCDTKTQARVLYGRLRAEIREGTYFPDKFAKCEALTLRAWIGRYLEGSTNRNIVGERRYGRFWSLLLGTSLLTTITTEDLRRIQAKMKAQRKKSGATINRYFAFLRHALMLAVKDGKLDRNPMNGVSFFAESQQTRFLSDQELRQLQTVMDANDFQLVMFAVETGLRRGEQFGLRWDQVDLEVGMITLPLPKGGRTRHVPLSEAAKNILRLRISFLSSPWVFPSPFDPMRPLDAGAFVRRRYRPALHKAGIVGAKWHTLRHTAASCRIRADVDLLAVKEILGHRDIQTTMRYSHLSPGHLERAVNTGTPDWNRDLNRDQEMVVTFPH